MERKIAVVVYRAVNPDTVVVVAAAAVDTVEKTKRSVHFHGEVHIVQVDRAIAGPASQVEADEVMVANLKGLSRAQREVATANHADECRQKCADALDSFEVTIRKALLFLEDEDVAVITEVVEAVAVAQLVEHTGGFGMKEQKYCYPWIHSDVVMPIFGSPKAEMHLLESSNMMSVVGHHEASDGETVADVAHLMKLGRGKVSLITGHVIHR